MVCSFKTKYYIIFAFSFNPTFELPPFQFSTQSFSPKLTTFMGVSSDCSPINSGSNTSQQLSSSQLSLCSNQLDTSRATGTIRRTLPLSEHLVEQKTPDQSNSDVNDQLVTICHINTPHQFYVQLEEFSKVAESFSNLCKNKSEYAPQANSIRVDTLYLVQQRKAWHRAKVVNDMGDNMYAVFFVDYGRSEKVSADR